MIIQLPPVNPFDTCIGARLRAVREARGLSLRDLAKAARVTCADLSLAEHGRLRLSAAQLHGAIEALHIPLGLLFAANADLSRMRRL